MSEAETRDQLIAIRLHWLGDNRRGESWYPSIKWLCDQLEASLAAGTFADGHFVELEKFRQEHVECGNYVQASTIAAAIQRLRALTRTEPTAMKPPLGFGTDLGPAPAESAQPTCKACKGTGWIKGGSKFTQPMETRCHYCEPSPAPASGVSENSRRFVTDPVPCGCEVNQCAICSGEGRSEGFKGTNECKPCGGLGNYLDDTLCKYRATAPPAANVGDAVRKLINIASILPQPCGCSECQALYWGPLHEVIAKVEAALPVAAEKESK